MIQPALESRISFVWGALDTGKSKTIVRLIDTLRTSNASERILVCVVANVAIDQVAMRAYSFFSGRSEQEGFVRIYFET